MATQSRFRPGSSVATDDPVEGWKALVRERLAERASPKPWLRIWVAYGFLGLVLCVGSLGGWISLLATLPLFASVLLAQELPRALVARALGRVSRVAFTAAGGRIQLSGDLRGHSALLFAIVGSVTNLGCALLVLLGTRGRVLTEPTSLLASYALCHAAWGVAQLVPVAPFRLGEAIVGVGGPRVQLALAIATMLGVIRLGTFLGGLMAPPLLLVVAATLLFAAVRSAGQAIRAMWDAASGVDGIAAAAEACLARGEPAPANELALKGLGMARSHDKRSRLWKALAWAAIGRGDAFVAHAGLLGADPEDIDVHLLAAYLACCNRTDEAVELLEYAGGLDQRGAEATKLLIDLSFRCGDDETALELVRSNPSQLSLAEREAVESAVASRAD